MVVFGQGGCKRANWLYSGKMVVFGQKFLYSGKNFFIRAKAVIIGPCGCI